MAMTRRDAAGSLFSPLAEALDRFFEVSGHLIDEGTAHSPTMDLLTVGQPLPVDVYETAQEYVIDIAAPGIPPYELKIEATGQEILVRARFARLAHEGSGRYVRRERYEGEMERRIPLLAPIDANRITTTYGYGLLTLRAPKILQAQATSIDPAAEASADGLGRTAPIR
jgi:HSP20 family protein